jgi:hypothetical protein
MTTADDVIFMVKKMAASDIRELGNSDSQQNTYLLAYITRALKELAHIAYISKESDVLNITQDGYQTFLQDGNPVDMYAPLRILDQNGRPVEKRTAFDGPKGWWRESASTKIHTKGMNGNYTLHYIAYPKSVQSTTDMVEFPDAGIMGLVFWTCGIIKESANGYQEAQVMYDRAKERLKVAIAANDYGRGKSTGGWVPSLNDVGMIY